jgi:predicted  nucleic acid-binding Zn-ribbon protein
MGKSYFECAKCGKVSLLTDMQSRCPLCGCQSGTYSPEPPENKEVQRDPLPMSSS